MLEFQRRQRLQFALFGMLLVAAAAKQPIERHVWTKPRSSEWWDWIVMRTFDEKDWLENFRMGKDTYMYICNELREHIKKKDTFMRQSISVEKRVAVTIWRLATNVEYRSIGHLFGISRASVCCIVHEVCEQIVELLMPKYIKWPTGEHLTDVIHVFEQKWGYPQCAGAVDGSHIPILAPEEFHNDYFNRKGWHSVILQGVVDGQYCFTDINVGWPGSVHDARVFSNSDVYKKGQSETLCCATQKQLGGVAIPVHIIGDAAYPLLKWLMKLYSDTGRLTLPQRTFNYRLSRARNVVENAFGRLKGRWRSLLKRNDCSLEFVKVQVAACTTLHNICEKHGERYYDDWTEVVRNVELPHPHTRCTRTEDRAVEIRIALTRHFSQD